jgi:hypothetical protein
VSRPVSGFGPYPGGVPPVLGQVMLYSERDSARLVMKLGDGPALVTEGYGGWDKVARARRHSLTQWAGQNGWTVTVPVLFDSMGTDQTVEDQVRRLEWMAYRDEAVREPPQLVVDALGVVPHDYSQEPRTRWVLEDIGWDAASFVRRNFDGKLVRATAVLTLFEYVRDDKLAKLPPAHRHTTAKGGSNRVRYVHVHKNDTLRGIAKTNHTTVAELKKLNKIRDPRHWLAHHDKIRVA